MSKPTVTLSLIIPIYNEEQALPVFQAQLLAVLKTLDIPFEVLLIDDGSTDTTWDCIVQISQKNQAFRGIRFTRNFGKEAAIFAGLKEAVGDAVIVMDCDGQHPAKLIPQMLEHWQNKIPMVIARKRRREHDSYLHRVAANGFNSLMLRLTGLDLNNSTDFRLLDRELSKALLQCPERIRFFRGMTEWTGFKSISIEFDVPRRLAGKSHWQQSALFGLALQAIAAYSAKPLFYLFAFGVFGICLSFLLALQAVYSWLTGIAVSGWTSITILLLFFGSANMLGIGALGIYLAQVFDEVKQRPRYLIQEITESITSKASGFFFF